MPTLPPPCFTDEVVCLGSWAVPFLLHTLLFPSLWYKLILVSSVHRMLFQNCEGKELLMILSIPPHQWSMVVVAWACMAASGTGSLVFIDDVTTEFWSVSGNIICSYSAKCFRTHWTALHSADGQWPKAYCKSNQRVFEGKEVDCYAMAKSITWPESDWACISLAEDKTEGKMPQEQAGTEDGCSRGLAEHHQGWNPASGDVYAFQTSGCNWLQRICNQVLKSESLIYDYYSVPLLLVP